MFINLIFPLLSLFCCFFTHFCCCFALQGSIKFSSYLFALPQLLLSSPLLLRLLSSLSFNTFNQIRQPLSFSTYLQFSSSLRLVMTSFSDFCFYFLFHQVLSLSSLFFFSFALLLSFSSHGSLHLSIPLHINIPFLL